MKAKLDKEDILAAVGRCIDVINASDAQPDHHLLAGGGETIRTCQWFVALGFAGTDMGEMLRGMIAKTQATDEHYRQVRQGNVNIHESSDQELPRD